MKPLLPSIAFILVAAPLAHATSLPIPAGADERIPSPAIRVTPDRKDWSYEPGDKVTFTIEVLSDGQRVPGAVVSYRVGPEQLEEDPVKVTLPDGRLILGGYTMQTPGFLRCTASTTIAGHTYHDRATAAFSPEDIAPTQIDPDDFDAFWKEQLSQLEDTPLRLRKTLLPDRCTPEVDVFSVRYESRDRGRPVPFYGILTIPAAKGTYPAILRVPGAGVRSYYGMESLSRKGLIVLEIGIHSIPVSLEGSIYSDLKSAALRGYNRFNLDDRERYYYNRVYLGCVRGLDVLTTLPEWDKETLVVYGGSQGGQLSLVTSALDQRVTGTVTNYPAYCDVTGYLHGRAGGWPHLFLTGGEATPEKILTSAYYDAVNFARRLHAPVSMAFGYNDTVCPPTSMFAAYNVISAEKELHILPEMGHRPSTEFSRQTEQRVLRMAGIDGEPQ